MADCCAGEDEEALPVLDEELLALGEATAEVATVPPPSPEGMILADSLVYVASPAQCTKASVALETTRRTHNRQPGVFGAGKENVDVLSSGLCSKERRSKTEDRVLGRLLCVVW